MEFLYIALAILLVYFIAKRASRKEAKQYVEENPEPKEAQNIETVDPLTQTLVEFIFLSKKDQFMINSFPNIIIDGRDKFKMLDDQLTLKLPPKFHVHFGVPYMKGEAFKSDQSFNFVAGRKYKITYKPKAFVFSKPKVMIQEMGSI